MTEKKVQKRTLESREKIMKAAWQLFCEKGYYNTNTKEIAALAGVSVGNFYNYFEDKLKVYNKLAEQFLNEALQAVEVMENALKSAENPRKLLRQYVYGQIEHSLHTGRFFNDCQTLAPDSPELQQLFEQNTEAIITCSEHLLPRVPGIQKRAPFQVMSRMLYAMIDNLSHVAYAQAETDQFELYRDQIADIVEYYMFGEA